MPKKKAIYKIEDVVVSIFCPHCQNQQHSPHYPGSFGWDKKDVAGIGLSGDVTCRVCHERFPLPAALFNLLAGL